MDQFSNAKHLIQKFHNSNLVREHPHFDQLVKKMSFLNRIFANVAKSVPSVSAASSPAASETRSIARERLQIILSRERASNRLAHVDVSSMQKDLLKVVQKYIAVTTDEVTVSVKKDSGLDVFEMQVVLAEGMPLAASDSSLSHPVLEHHDAAPVAPSLQSVPEPAIVKPSSTTKKSTSRKRSSSSSDTVVLGPAA